jgi:hypothetical protein
MEVYCCGCGMKMFSVVRKTNILCQTCGTSRVPIPIRYCNCCGRDWSYIETGIASLKCLDCQVKGHSHDTSQVVC